MLTNRKAEHRRGQVQLIDASAWFRPLRKNLGSKNCELSADDIQRIVETFLAFEESETSKLFPNAAFGYWKVIVERPLRLKGTDPNKAYSPAEIKRLKEENERDAAARPVIRRIHKAVRIVADSMNGLFETVIDGKKYRTQSYNLDVIISVGCRVKSLRGAQVRIWATNRLREYLVKGFIMDDKRLKDQAGGGYFDELLARIRDIRSSEKLFWRKVLDIYATSVDYDPDAEASQTFFQDNGVRLFNGQPILL